jgi:hypothetical protein
MKFFTLTKASDISHNEIVFLSDVSGDDRIFSVEGLPHFSLGEILSVRKQSGEFRLSIKADDGSYEVAAFPWHKFAVYTPDKISIRNLSVGDKVLLRGENALPDPLEDASRMSCVSEVLEISKNRKSELEVVFKLSRPVVTKQRIGRFELPFSTAQRTAIRMRFSPDSKIEISHDGYA